MRLVAHPADCPYQSGLDRNPANYAPLTPISFIERAADVYPGRIAWIYGDTRATYAAFRARARKLAAALAGRGVGPGDTVAVMLPNTPPMLEAHFGVPMAGAVLNSINIRLEPATIAYILEHGAAKVLLTDTEFAPTIREALAGIGSRPLVVDVVDRQFRGEHERLGEVTYEELLSEGDEACEPCYPADEWQAIGLNYTSGTTGQPKGVVVHHRGAYLAAIGQVLANEIGLHPTYLWTLPMFHCNGWTFTWAATLQAGTHVCLRRVEAPSIFAAIAEHKVTHLCGAPIVMNMIANAPDEARRPFGQRVQAMTGGAAPPAAVLQKLADQGIDVIHLYGLTECYGPATVCAWQEDWDALSAEDQARMQARQGVRYPTLEAVAVIDPATMEPAPRDGRAMGEIMLRGNTVMKGYLKNPAATAEAFQGDWYHTGDLAAVHPDGYCEVMDRSKDIIISGGENISSIEVEGALYRHPAVLEAAVVARPDPKWGESPCAFVTLKPGAAATAEDLIDHCRTLLAGFKCPRTVIFTELPKTATGKIQKHVLRDQARTLSVAEGGISLRTD
ncbi:MAG TPA: acyl-CoA synthetase [Geminicoccaceae bacterium]|nr:acyl-CoA synthetase [Geminicoccaceae bacterium]